MSTDVIEEPNRTADESLKCLIEGNERFVSGKPTGLGSYRYSRGDLTEGQFPFATILGCSDSRVPPELIFDTGLGELFVIRVAGNVFSDEIAGSLQYAGSHLNTPLFVVLGHSRCGAVFAALGNVDNDRRHLARIQILVDSIAPAIMNIDLALTPEQRLDIAVERNVKWTVQQIMDTTEARIREAEGKFKIIGAIYDISTGRVNILPESDATD
jgi:carbonic anhydrase